MAEEKLNTGQGDQLTIEPSDTPAPGQPAGGISMPEQDGPAQPGAGDVVVDAQQIDALMAKQRAEARQAVEQENTAE